MGYQYNATPGRLSPGIQEENLHIATGLRNANLSAIISSNLGGICPSTAVGTIDGSPGSTSLRAGATAWNGNLPVPMTPSLFCILVPLECYTGSHGAVTFRAHATGIDQFGNVIEEWTPWLTKTQTSTSQVILVTFSKVFAYVTDVVMHTSNVTGPLVSTVSCGWHTCIDPTAIQASALTDYTAFWVLGGLGPTTTASNLDTLGSWANWGVGTPIRMQPYGPSTPFPTPEVMGAMALIIRDRNTPAVINKAGRLAPQGQLVESGAAPTTGVCIGRSASGWQGCPHKFGFFSDDTWATKLNSVNGTATASSSTTLTNSGASFPSMVGWTVRAGSSYATVSSNTATVITVSAWVGGTPSGTATYSVTNLNLGGSSTYNGGIPTAGAGVGRDDIELSSLLRTTFNTQRGSNATKSYRD